MVLKIAIVLIAIIVLVVVGYFGYSMYMNQTLTEANLKYFETYSEGLKKSPLVSLDKDVAQTICSMDFSNPDISCINKTTAERLDCNSLESGNVRIMGIPLNSCDKEKLDSKFDDIGNYDEREQSYYVSVSIRYALSDIVEEFLIFIKKNYETDSSYANKFGDTMALLQIVTSGGDVWQEISSATVSCVYEYEGDEKASDCLTEMVGAFDSVSDDMKGEILFDEEWTELCTRNLQSLGESAFDEMKKGISLTSEYQLCQRMGTVFNRIINSIDENDQNTVERLYTSAVFYVISTGPIGKYESFEISKKIGEKLSPEFSEAKEKIREF